MTEDDMRDLFREMRDEPVPAESLGRVRLAVEQRTRGGSRTWLPWKAMHWKAAAAIAVGGALVAFLLWIAVPVRKVTPPLGARQIEEHAPTVAAVPLPTPATVRRAVRPARHTKHESPVSGSVLIRLETQDPEVVILLIGD